MTFEVIDTGGNARDEAWLLGKYGVRIERATGARFSLIRVVCTVGPAVMSAAVIRPDGMSDVGRKVALSWPGIQAEAGTQNIFIDPAYKTRPSEVACVQMVEANGFVRGFGLSVDWYGVPPSGGPGVMWVLSPSIPSDVVRGLGMLPNTVHEGPLVLTFREVTDGGTEPPPIEPPPTGTTDWAAALAKLDAKLDTLLANDQAQSAMLAEVLNHCDAILNKLDAWSNGLPTGEEAQTEALIGLRADVRKIAVDKLGMTF